ncbi:hypothetical protein C8R45DRAFT_1113782 [Mycena sanguinolenta]|nr:hypothetical protein C8R45DRAFT_1113782 [Mycena sanguinolenta]
MVGDFIAPEYGWMRSKKRDTATGEFKNARNLFKVGKKRKGYQTTQHILDQLTRAMDILDEDYADEKHVLAATKMTAGPSENFNKFKCDDGMTYLVHMRDGNFHDGTAQSLYLPDGRFKGMKMIIQER